PTEVGAGRLQRSSSRPVRGRGWAGAIPGRRRWASASWCAVRATPPATSSRSSPPGTSAATRTTPPSACASPCGERRLTGRSACRVGLRPVVAQPDELPPQLDDVLLGMPVVAPLAADLVVEQSQQQVDLVGRQGDVV